MVSDREGAALRERLLRDGYVVVGGVLDRDEIERWRRVTDRVLAVKGEKHAAVFKSQGSMIRTVTDPEFVDLVTNPATLAVIAAMGWATPTHTDGYVISKPPGGVRLFWHYDWFCWDDPVSYDQSPPQIFAMYYLQDTTRANGSLRVIPGSHRTHNALHDLLDEPHSAELTKAGDLSHPGFSTRQDEIDVPIRAGDLLLGDARLLHAAHANNSDERRTLVTIWYQPDFDALPERAQAQMMAKLHHPPEAYPAEARAKLATITPRYAGEAVPYERQLYRPCPEV